LSLNNREGGNEMKTKAVVLMRTYVWAMKSNAVLFTQVRGILQ